MDFPFKITNTNTNPNTNTNTDFINTKISDFPFQNLFVSIYLSIYLSEEQEERKKKMAYVDHAFSIIDEDMMMETSYTRNNKAPIIEIALAVCLLVFSTLGIIISIFMAVNRIGSDCAHGAFFSLFIQYPLCVFLL